MAEYKYQTREELAEKVLEKFPAKYQGQNLDAIYNDYTTKFPEYKSQVAEENQIKIDSSIFTGEPEEDANVDPKNAFTAMKEVFSAKDGYKYLPFVRDLEIAESVDLLVAGKRVAKGEGTEEDITKIKNFTLDRDREKTWGYKTVQLIAQIPAYAGEIAAMFLTAGLAVGAKGGLVATKTASKATRDAVLKRAMKRITLDEAKKSGKKLTAKQNLQRITLNTIADVGNMEFARRLARGAAMAKNKEVGDYIRKVGIAGTLKGQAQTLGVGIRSAAAMNVFRSPQAINQALQKMAPTFVTEEGLDEEVALRFVDDGDDIIPALAKAYADQGIEYFSESVGSSLYFMHHFFGGEALRKGFVAAVNKGFSKVPGNEAISSAIVNMPLKAAMLNHLSKFKATPELKEILARAGWNGTIAEMYEERVGGALRKITPGLEGEIIPPIDQLMSEAVAFSIFGGLSSTADVMTRTKLLGGQGIENYRKVQELVNTDPTSPEAVKLESELNEILNEQADLARDQAENPTLLTSLMRKVKFGKFEPFANYERRGSLSEALTMIGADSLDARIRADIAEGKSPEVIRENAKDMIREHLKAQGIREVKTEADRKRFQKLIQDKQATFHRDAEGRGFYTVDMNKVAENYETTDARNIVETLQQDRTTLFINDKTYQELNTNGVLEGTSINHILDTKNPEAPPSIGEVMKLFNMSSPAEAKATFEALQIVYKSLNKANKNAKEPKRITINILPNVAVIRTKEELEASGYAVPKGQEGAKKFVSYIGGRTEIDPTDPNHIIIGLSGYANASVLFEELIEGIAKSVDITDPTFTMVRDVIKRAVKAAGIEGYSEVETISKSIVASVLGNYIGQDAELFNSIEFTQNEKDLLTAFLETYLGEQAINAMIKEQAREAENAQTEESTSTDAVPEINETESQEKEEPAKKQQLTEKLEDAAQQDEIDKEAAEKIIEEVATAVDSLPSTPEALILKTGVRALEEMIAQGDVDGKTMVRTALNILNRSGVSFAQNVIAVDEDMSSDEAMELGLQATYNDVMHDLKILQDITSSLLGQKIDALYGGQHAALEYLYSILRDNAETKELIQDIIKNQDRFDEFINTSPLNFKLNVLHTALKEILTEGKADNAEGLRLLERMYRRYENLEVLPVYEMSISKSGKPLIKTLNQGYNELRFRELIYKQLQFHLRNGNIQGLMQKFQASVRNGQVDVDTMAKNFSIITGLKPELFKMMDIQDSLNRKRLRRFYEEFMVALDIASNQGSRGAQATFLAKWFYEHKATMGSPTTMLTDLLRFNPLHAGLSLNYTNTEGNKELAVRSASHLIKARNAIAAELGIKPSEALAMLSGVSVEVTNRTNKKGAKKLLGAERDKQLFELFKASEGGQYWQSAGQMGGKNQIYLFKSKKYETPEDIRNAIQEYTKYYEAQNKHAKKFLAEPQELNRLYNSYLRSNNESLLFDINTIINKAKHGQVLHGDYSQYKDLGDLVKRAAIIPTPGEAFKTKKTIRFIVVQDSDLADGMGIFSNQFGSEHAAYHGAIYSKGNSSSPSIKPVVTFIDSTGQRRILKGNLINADLLGNLVTWKAAKEWLDKYNQENPEAPIDMIIPSSMVKGTYVSQGTLDNLPEDTSSIAIETIPGSEFITVQNLNYGTEVTVKNQSKQQITDTLFGLHTDKIIDLVNSNTQDLLDMIDESFNIEFSQAAASTAQQLRESKGDLTLLDQEAIDTITNIAKKFRPYDNMEVSDGQLAAELIQVVQGILRDHTWTEEADAKYFESVFRAINEGVSELDPAISQVVSQIKARFIQRATRRQLPRAMMQKVAAVDQFIPTFEQIGSNVRLPMIMSNTQDVRQTRGGFKNKAAAIKEIQDNPEKYQDMFVIDDKGNVTNKIRDYELRNPEESQKLGLQGWSIPGGIIVESRIPGENMQSHIPHRLLKPVNVSGTGNFSVSPLDVSLAKGEDFDGDIGYQYVLYNNPKSVIEDRRNLQILLMADAYSKPEYLESAQYIVNPKLFDKLNGRLDEGTPVYNSRSGEIWANESNSTALDALGRVAQYVKFYDIAEYLEFSLKSDAKINNMTFGNVSIKYHTGPRADKKTENIAVTVRKRAYSTAMINITVDNVSNQQMRKLGLDEISTPIAQILLFLQTDINDSNIQNRMQDIVDFLLSPNTQKYISARREYESLSFDRNVAPYNGKTRVEILDMMMKELGVENTTNLLELDKVIQEVGLIANFIDSQYNAPKSAAEVILRRQTRDAIFENNLQIFDVGNAVVNDTFAPILKPINTYLEQLVNQAFSNNILLSQQGQAIRDSFKDHQKDNQLFLEEAEKNILRMLAIRAVTKENKPNYENELGYLMDLIQKEQQADSTNLFLHMLTQDTKGNNRIMLDPLFHMNNIRPDMVDRARADFKKLSPELQESLIRHQVLVYGMTGSTWGGGYMSLIPGDVRKQLSEQVAEEIIKFNQGKAPKDFIDFITQPSGKLKKTPIEWKYKAKKVWYQQKDPIVTNTILKESILRQDTNWLERIPAKYFVEEGVTIQDIINEINYAKEASLIDQTVIENPDNLNIQPDNLGSDTSSYSLLEYHQAVTYTSALMMSGAEGAHKRFLDLINDADTTRIMGRLMRENWEKRVGARQKLGRGNRKLTPEEILRGEEVLAAIAAKITGTNKVILGVDVIEAELNDAVRIIVDRYAKRYGNKVLAARDKNQNRIKKANKLIAEGKVAERPLNTFRDVLSVLVEAELKEYQKVKGVGTVPVSIAKVSSKTADQIIASYNASRGKEFESADVIMQEIMDMFEASRVAFNSQKTAYLNKIPKRANYLPMLKSIDPYRIDLLEEENQEIDNYGGDVRGLARTSGIDTFEDMINAGYIPLTTNPADLYEIYTKQTSHDRYMSSVWQMMVMSKMPDNSPLLIPQFNIQELLANPIFDQQFINAYAEQLEFGMPNMTRGAKEGPLAFIERALEERDQNWVAYNTGINSMPVVYVRPGRAENVVKMITNLRNEGKFWKVWANLTNWTKFFAIGVPYLSWFHHFALVESQIGIGGLRNSSAYKPRKNWLAFKKFAKDLEADPYIAEKWYKAGMKATLEDPDYAQGLVNSHIEAAAKYLQSNKHGSSAKALRKFVELKKNWDTKLWVQLHAPLKVWTAESLLYDRRMYAQRNGLPFNEKQALAEIADLVDSLYGGINFQRRIWATPGAIQMANNFSFAFDWTYAALNMAGAGNIPGLDQYFSRPNEYQNRIRYGQYVPAFLGIVMFAIPNAIQAAIWAATRPIGDDDDVPFTFMNEHDRRTWIDLTPLYRATPFYDMKQYGDRTGDRRVYLRWGKQGYEIGDWVTKPFRTAGYKLSVPLKQAIEQITGRSMGGWDLAFKDADYYGVFAAHGEFLEGRIGHSLKMFMPFSVQDIINRKPTPIPNLPVNFAKMKQGKHGWYASKQLSELYLAYIKKGNFEKLQDHRRNIQLIGMDILHAAQKNGFDPIKVQKTGLANARAELYAQLEDAVKKNRINEAEQIAVRLRGLEGTAYAIKKAFKEAQVGNK